MSKENKRVHIDYDAVFRKDYKQTGKEVHRTLSVEKRPNLERDNQYVTVQIELPTET